MGVAVLASAWASACSRGAATEDGSPAPTSAAPPPPGAVAVDPTVPAETERGADEPAPQPGEAVPADADCSREREPVVLVANVGDEVAGYDLDGDELWRREFDAVDVSGSYLPIADAVVAGRNVAVRVGGSTAIVRADDGAELGRHPGTFVEVSNSCGLVISGDGTITSIDATGAPAWARNGTSEARVIHTDPGALLIADDSSAVAEAVGLDSGTPMWVLDEQYDEIDVISSLVVSESAGNVATFYDGATGRPLYSDFSPEPEWVPLGESTLVVTEPEVETLRFEVIDLATGRAVFAGAAEADYAIDDVGSRGLVYLDPSDNLVYLDDVATGRAAWRVPLEDDHGEVEAQLLSTGAVVARLGNDLVVYSADGDVLWRESDLDADSVDVIADRILVTVGNATTVYDERGSDLATIESAAGQTGAHPAPARGHRGGSTDVVLIENDTAEGRRWIEALDVADGTVLWSYTLAGGAARVDAADGSGEATADPDESGEAPASTDGSADASAEPDDSGAWDGVWRPAPEGRTIRLGQFGRQVERLQDALVARGYEIEVDGYFGYATQLVVRQFQIDRGLPVTGVASDEVWDLIGE